MCSQLQFNPYAPSCTIAPHPSHLPGKIELKYTHYSVILNEQRRMAFVSAVNIDGTRRVMLPRDDGAKVFAFDPRVPEEVQWGSALYDDNVLDKGHLTRRQDPVWGDEGEARVSRDARRGGGLNMG